MSIAGDPRSADADAEPEPEPDPEPEPETTPARFGRTVAVEWIQPPEPRGGWTDYATLEPRPVQTCLSVGRLVHDDDCVKILAGSAMISGDDERVMLSGIIEIPARCVVKIVRLGGRPTELAASRPLASGGKSCRADPRSRLGIATAPEAPEPKCSGAYSTSEKHRLRSSQCLIGGLRKRTVFLHGVLLTSSEFPFEGVW